jgi:hypothetical protein
MTPICIINNEIIVLLLLSSYATTCQGVRAYGMAAADPLYHGAGKLDQALHDLYA